MKIQDLYNNFADALGMTDAEGGRLSLRVGEKLVPVTVTKKRLSLPHTEVLRHLHDSDMIAMHPMCENITMSESPVNERIRKLIQLRLTSVCNNLTKMLMEIAVNVNGHSKLNPDQTEVVTLLSNVDSKLAAQWVDITENVTMTGKDRAVNVYVKRGGKKDGKTYHRLAVINFPIYQAIVDGRDSHEIYGVKMRKGAKDYVALERLMDYVLPEIGKNPQRYWFGSSSDTAPQFHAMANGFRNVAEQFNRVTDLFRDVMGEENYETLHINDAWFDHVCEVDSYRDKLPILEGNAGGAGGANNAQAEAPAPMAPMNSTALAAASLVDDTPATTTLSPGNVNAPAMTITPAAMTPQPVMHQVAPINTPAATNSDGAIEWDRVGNTVRPNPMMNFNNGMYGQPQQQVAPGGYAGNVPYGQQPVQQTIPFQQPQTMQTFVQPQPMHVAQTSATGIPGWVSPL